jgi:ribonuclease I
MNPKYYFAQMRELLDEFEPSRERSFAATKIDEAEMWLDKCQPTEESRNRDLKAGLHESHFRRLHDVHG